MRAITPVLSVLLIVALSVALVGFLWLFVSGTFNSLTSSGTSTVNESLVTISSCMKIESVYGNQVSIRNCGEGVIAQDTLSAYLDDIPLNVTINSAVINEDETGTVTLSGLWNFNAGGHTLKVTNPRVVTETPVNAVLPDSTVLDLDFDEGSGATAYDKSGYGNNGILGDGTCTPGSGSCPLWVYGKHGNALQFDGVDDYVNCGNDSSLDTPTEITAELWIKFNSVSGWQSLLHKNIDTGNHNELYLESNGGVLYNWNTISSVTTVFSAGESYYHVLYTSNPYADFERLYVNGELKNEETNQFLGMENTYDFLIGKSGADVEKFNGVIDSVRIFNKSLTPDETIVLKPVSYD